MGKTRVHYRREQIAKEVELKYAGRVRGIPREHKVHCGKSVCDFVLVGSNEENVFTEAYTFLVDLIKIPIDTENEELCPECAKHEDVAMAVLAGVK